MILKEYYTLPGGVRLPKLGLGTWFIPDGDAAQAVRQAVASGYRMVDTAQAYGNESGVGAGVNSCGLPRTELFVTSKIAAEHKTYAAAAASIDESLTKMGLDYIDMMLIHSPQPWAEVNQSDDRYIEGNREAWRALEDAYRAGKVRAIGVSNFQEDDLDSLLEAAAIKPMVDQVLCHISNTPAALLAYCRDKGIQPESYAPVAHGEALKNPAIGAMAEQYGVTIPQLCIRYCLQLGTAVLAKTANPAHMQANAAVDFEISAADMDKLMRFEKIHDYGEFSRFPVFGGKKQRG